MGKLVSLIYRLSQRFLDEQLDGLPVGRGQFTFLMSLLHQDGISQRELAERLHTDPGATARALEKLEQSGLILRVAVEGNRRANRVCVTKAARKLLPALRDVDRRWDERVLGSASAKERARAATLLQQMATNATRTVTEGQDVARAGSAGALGKAR